MRVARTAALMLPLVIMAGCVNLAPKTPDRLISLTPQAAVPAGMLVSQPEARTVVVMDPQADRALEVLSVPVQVTPDSIAYLKNARWVERPARQLRSLMAEAVRVRNGVPVIEGFGGERDDRRVLGGRLSQMGFDAGMQAVIVRFDAELREPDGSVVSRRFESRVDGVTPKVDAVAPALNQAANDVATQVADWLAGRAAAPDAISAPAAQ